MAADALSVACEINGGRPWGVVVLTSAGSSAVMVSIKSPRRRRRYGNPVQGIGAKGWLLKNGQVPAERVFIVAAKAGVAAKGASGTRSSRVDFSLR